MKKPLLFLAITLSLCTSAQLPNLDFENWGSTSLGLQPNGWGGSIVSKQTTGAHSGTSFARVTTSTIYDGVMFTGYFSGGGTYKSGVAYTQKPNSITGFYKTSGLNAGDTAIIGFRSFYGNSHAWVTAGNFKESNNVSTWTSFSIPLTYTNSLSPDTAILYVASNPKTMGFGANSINSTIDIDDVSVSGVTGIDENTIGTSFVAFPNPANKEFTIISKNESASAVLISDEFGKTINTILIENEKSSINVADFSNGVYFYSILDKNKKPLFNSKFVVNN